MKKTFLLVIVCVFVFVGCTSKTISSDVPSWQEQYDLGVRYLNEGNYEEAIIAFTAAIEIDEKNTAAYLGRAEAYIGRGENDENLSLAIKDYEKVIELDESVSAAYLGMADVYIRLGEYDKALEILKNAPDSAKNDEIAAKIAELESGNVSDASGKERKMSVYDASGNLICYHEYTYNKKGKKNSVSNHLADGTNTKTIELLYDENGNIIQSYWWGVGNLGRETMEYDDNGLIVKECYYDAETDELERYEIMEYNAQGQRIKSTEFSPDGGIRKYSFCEYNADGQIIKESNYYPSYENDAENSEKITFKLSDYKTYEYDEQGKLTKCSYFLSNGDCHAYDICEYNDNGKLTRLLFYSGDGTLKNETKFN